MDPNPTAEDQSVTPATEPAPDAPQSLSGWFRQNGVQLAVVAAVIIAVCSYLHPIDVFLATLGLSLIIFIHELGHFATAKWCDVHVKTFSIGFGPALPFCQFQYGETTYKLAMIPLGGYVAMVGEGESEGDTVEAEEDPEKADADPRSFKNKPVLQRMLIISAGVIMNVLLGGVCFAIVYLHGIEEAPAIASSVEPGSGAWRAGLRPGVEIDRINSREHPWFDDLRPSVTSVRKGEHVSLEVEYRGERRALSLEPLRQEGALFPQLGITPPQQMVLRNFRRGDVIPYAPGSSAAAATAADGGPGFKAGDRIIAMTDPADPTKVTPLEPNWNKLPGEYFDYDRRLTALAKQPITFHIARKDSLPSTTPITITVNPTYRQDLGLRMRMDRVAAIRQGSPAEKAGLVARVRDGDKELVKGDRIVAVEVKEANGSTTLFTTDRTTASTAPSVQVQPLDPLRLPRELNDWAKRTPSPGKVAVTVLRQPEGEHTDRAVKLEMDWQADYAEESEILANVGTPLAIGGLGLAYHVQRVVDAVEPFAAADRDRLPSTAAVLGVAAFTAKAAPSPAALAGLQPDDQIAEVRFKAVDHKGKKSDGSWIEVREHQWAYADYSLQFQAPHALDARVKRGDQTLEVSLAATDDPSWVIPDRGIFLSPERRLQKAEGLLEALQMGANRTARSVKMMYLGLYSMAFGQVSSKMMSGPISLARVSYLLAGEDIWHLLIFLALISINLAVVNFLPIPVLDGGHMVFLLYELVRGKPAPASVQVVLTYLGLAIILGLMLFVIGQDILRLL